MVQSVSLPNPAVTVLGRASMRDKAIAFDWTNSGIYFRFRGSSITLHFDTPALGQCLHVQLTIDGRYSRAAVVGDTTAVTADALFDGEHIVHCVRINEVLDGVPLVLNALTLDGDAPALLPAPSLPERRMLFIGDSITCGYGNLTRGTGNGFTTTEQDGAHTYAALTAAHFQAQAHFVCISGRGIARNCDNYPAPLIPAFFEQTGISDPTPWDHSQYQPDIVVINAGTNDTVGEEAPVDVELFKASAARFIHRLREVYPNAEILWVYGMMAGEMHEPLRDTIASLHDEHVHYHKLQSVWEFENEQGASCHPNLRSHHRCAGVLIDKVSELVGWQV